MVRADPQELAEHAQQAAEHAESFERERRERELDLVPLQERLEGQRAEGRSRWDENTGKTREHSPLWISGEILTVRVFISGHAGQAGRGVWAAEGERCERESHCSGADGSAAGAFKLDFAPTFAPLLLHVYFKFAPFLLTIERKRSF